MLPARGVRGARRTLNAQNESLDVERVLRLLSRFVEDFVDFFQALVVLFAQEERVQVPVFLVLRVDSEGLVLRLLLLDGRRRHVDRARGFHFGFRIFKFKIIIFT